MIRQFTGLGLKEAKELVEKTPCVVLESYDKHTVISMYDEFLAIKPYNNYEYKAPVKVVVNDFRGEPFLSNF